MRGRKRKLAVMMAFACGGGSDAMAARGSHGAARRSSRPTHFVAVRIDDGEIQRRVRAIQGRLVARDRSLGRCLVSPTRLHVTLGLLRLGSADDVERARAIVPAAAARAARTIRCGLPGLDAFGSSVLFARLQDDGALAALASHVGDEIAKAGFADVQPSFRAHATIAKTSKATRRIRIDLDAFADLRDSPLGTVDVTHLELLAMRGEGAGGYYPVVERAPLGSAGINAIGQ
mmetsp:Transcript_32324/g.103075  ORF Transcript_32324/g.103075 Transcript_32324/m.103075 type:complete len:232 (+) Transcript_32324:14-709(+)